MSLSNDPSASAHASLARSLCHGAMRPSALALLVFALGCSSDGVDLGGGVVTQDLRRGTRCVESTTIDDNVLVGSQAELDALEGCEQILGDLNIQLLAGADLTPLHALRVVDGALVLGSSKLDVLTSDEYDDVERVQAIQDAEAPLEGTWLGSLAGLESLERAAGLQIFGTALVDLEPLGRLDRLAGNLSGRSEWTVSPGGILLERNANLESLAGLDNLTDVNDVQVVSSPALHSLAGLSLSSALNVFNVMDTPQLTDIDAVSVVTSMGVLVLQNTGITNLDALAQVANVSDSLFVIDNPALVDATGLSNVAQSASVLFSGNAALKTLPSFASYFTLPDNITIRDNDELETIVIDAPFANALASAVGGQYRAFNSELIQISGNAKLSSFTLVPALADVIGLRAVQVVALESNPSLVHADFGSLTRADMLVINDNATLSDVSLGELDTVNSLVLAGNPALDVSRFDAVRTFDRVVSDAPIVEAE